MLVATIVGVFIYPALFVLVDGLVRRREAPAAAAPAAAVAAEGHHP